MRGVSHPVVTIYFHSIFYLAAELERDRLLERQAKLFGYDSEQNLCEVSEIMASSGVPLSVSQAVSEGQRRYDGAGRIVERGDVRYEYDVCGRLSRKREVRAGSRPKETPSHITW
ncbi:hypothetical protein [Lonsdalea quercina]|uniref:hypothetical protein n=1 Tax=Lonsdalea quercina TaxID=71657 RepID=UPI003975AC1A